MFRRNPHPRRLAAQRRKPWLGVVVVILFLAAGLYLWQRLAARPHIDYDYYQEVATHYDGQVLSGQAEIEAIIMERGDRPQDVGHLFIPPYPAEYPDLQEVPQLNIPYYNQNDPRWGWLQYDSDSSQRLWENGCAIVSLAMVDAYYQGNTTPQDILDWAGDNYYIDGQGSSWEIYPNFGLAFGYQVTDLGNDFHQAMDYLTAGQPIIVAVGPGPFTQAGHVMVVRGYDGYNVYLNDPNDSPAEFWSIQPVAAQTLVDSGMNYWAFGRN